MKKVIVLCFEDSNEEIIQDILELVGEKYPEYDRLEPNLIISFDGLEINIPEKRVLLDGSYIHLSRIEFSLLTYLAKHPGWVRSRRQIYNEVWPLEAETELHAVESAISSLRKKIDPHLEQPRFIETVPCHGYRFIGTKRIQ